MSRLQDIANGSLMLHKAALLYSQEDKENAINALNKVQLPGSSPLTLFKEDKNLGDYLSYIDDAARSGSAGAKSLTNTARIGAVALPALTGGLLGGGSLLNGLGRGALTGLGGLAGYEGGRALANSDYVKKLVPEGSSIRTIAPWVTTLGGALLGHVLGGKLMGEEKSAAVMEKYASYYAETANVDMEKVAFAALAGLAGNLARYGGQAAKWLAPHAKNVIQGGGRMFRDGLNWVGRQGNNLMRQGGQMAKNTLQGASKQMNSLSKSLTNGSIQQAASRMDSAVQQGYQAAKNFGGRMMEAGRQGFNAARQSMATSAGAAGNAAGGAAQAASGAAQAVR